VKWGSCTSLHRSRKYWFFSRNRILLVRCSSDSQTYACHVEGTLSSNDISGLAISWDATVRIRRCFILVLQKRDEKRRGAVLPVGYSSLFYKSSRCRAMTISEAPPATIHCLCRIPRMAARRIWRYYSLQDSLSPCRFLDARAFTDGFFSFLLEPGVEGRILHCSCDSIATRARLSFHHSVAPARAVHVRPPRESPGPRAVLRDRPRASQCPRRKSAVGAALAALSGVLLTCLSTFHSNTLLLGDLNVVALCPAVSRPIHHRIRLCTALKPDFAVTLAVFPPGLPAVCARNALC
jgi:hypothetical protein